MTDLTHFDDVGRARMVDVSDKADTARVAVARGRVTMQATTVERIRAGALAKGDVLAVAQLAGVMGAKRTADVIPLCHPLPITGVSVVLTLAEDAPAVDIEATVKTTGKTGVEMEALTAVTVAALTIYDMCKAIDKGMRIEQVRLTHKSGGRSGDFHAE